MEEKIDLKQDGNQWRLLWGENLQEGEVGYGDTPSQAITALGDALRSEEDKERIANQMLDMIDLSASLDTIDTDLLKDRLKKVL